MNNEHIEYRDIPGFPGYGVDNHGNVWSRRQRRYVKGRRGAGSCVVKDRHKLKPCLDNNGYFYVTLYVNREKIRRSVHSLILDTFRGKARLGMIARHYNGNPVDNRLDNLLWGTMQDNANDRMRHGTVYRPIGDIHHMRKLTSKVIPAIRAMLAAGLPMSKIAAKYGVGTSTINCVDKGRTWAHVP